jgi:hypothetical protein
MSESRRYVYCPSGRRWVAFRDRAWHFDWDTAASRWMDDRSQKIEALSLIEDLTKQQTTLTVPSPGHRVTNETSIHARARGKAIVGWSLQS